MSKVQQSPRVQDGDRDAGHWTLDTGLRVSDLRKSFSSPAGERIDVLLGLSFSANPGQTVAITGVSGAGKSTLLHLLGGLEEPDHGGIRLGSLAIDRAHRADLAAFRSRHVGFIFQFHHLLVDLNAVENVALPLLVTRANWREAMARAVRSLEESGLGARIGHPVGHLSGGELQRVAVCRALITQPALVLADEPTGNLDASLGLEIGETLVNYAHTNRALVVVATHNQVLAQRCDRILVLRDGKVIES